MKKCGRGSGVIGTGPVTRTSKNGDKPVTTASERMQAWYKNHLESLDPDRPEMTLDEINEEIRLARAERKARLAK